MLLNDKVAIITGIGPGLGQELAYTFVREGAQVAICCRRQSVLACTSSLLASRTFCGTTPPDDPHRVSSTSW
jgi:NAD(P)-dependent dehydrogenase (short-subunit alcohol dehydrogenase family)